jgi:hypothetical protein
MKKEVGLWVDHRKTVIVTLEAEADVTLEIHSNIAKRVRFLSGSHSKAVNDAHESTAEDMRDRQYGDHLDRYYDGIISFIRGADAIWIFGPGEAKVELANRLKHEELGGHIVGIETVDKMTDRQITAKVRQHFLEYPINKD